MTALLLVHGRSQEMAAGADRSAAAVAAYVEGRKREWLGGLARASPSPVIRRYCPDASTTRSTATCSPT